ncbi:MAG: hypothetical protein WBY44_00250 [Bryobacteraceae bacterium]
MISQTNEAQITETPVPWAQKPRDRRALSAYRHGLTGQIILLTDADRVAYEKHCQRYHQSYAPRGPVEVDLVQAVANDRWRLNHAACLESSIFADGITQPDEVTSGNAEVDTALAQGRVWISKGGNLQLLGLYESRIQRRFEKNMAEIRILQADRKTSLEQLLEEPDLLCQLAESKGEEADPSQFVTLTRFDFSGPDVIRLVTRRRALREARKKFQDPRKPSKIAA